MSNGNCFIVSYLEVAPVSAGAAAALIRQRGETSRKDDGFVRGDALRRSSPDNQFVLVSVWRDLAAFEKSRDGATSKDILAKLAPHLIAGLDSRVHNALIGGPDAGRGQGTVFTVTHIDVPPPNKDACIALVEAHVGASRKDAGCARYEVFQQADRPNHFSSVTAWSDRAAFDAHIAAAHTADFRKKLTPLSGALYDERIYEPAK
jgi:quinol monooxygenase YgiN